MEPFTTSITIKRPLAEVFDLASCLIRCSVWQSGIVAAQKETAGPVGVGTTYRHQVKFLGTIAETHPTITVWEPAHRLEFQDQSTRIPSGAVYTFEAVAGGTKFTAVVTGDTTGKFSNYGETFARRALMRQYETDLQTLKELLESGKPVKYPSDYA
jgi:hypothetical protein